MWLWRRGICAIVVAISIPWQAARADELMIPYSCVVSHGSVQLYPAANPGIYHIVGPREDLPFTTCAAAPSTACETMMVHKFAIDCGGQKVAWSRVAAASRALGVVLPDHLPTGFAPISRLGGRFVFPGFEPRAPFISQVSTQELSPDSVTDTSEAPRAKPSASWTTVVQADTTLGAADGAAKVAKVVTLLVACLVGACLLAMRRRLTWDAAAFSGIDRGTSWYSSERFASAFGAVGDAFRRSYDSWRNSSEPGGGNASVEHALAIVYARFAETEVLVLSLPPDLLLRDVLRTEVDGLRSRASDIAQRAGKLGTERASAMLRNLLRDLDRIQRIVHGASAGEATDARNEDDGRAPTSIYEAYRVLGLNSDAPYNAVKKVVDALRLSWHPDHARSEVDRLNRERRIKQINAAWDLLKGEHAAAA